MEKLLKKIDDEIEKIKISDGGEGSMHVMWVTNTLNWVKTLITEKQTADDEEFQKVFKELDSYKESIYPTDKVQQRKYKIITLCGSTKFKDAFIETQKWLTLQGYIVISVGLFGHSGDDEVWAEGTKTMLDDMHKKKIDMADEIFVINVGGYIGESTKSEIDYASKTGKTVIYLEH